MRTQVFNPRYSGGRDWKDRSLKPAEANSSQDPIVKKKKEKPIAKKGWQSGSGCMPQVQTLVPQKN
jgi:hypothetical protein